MKFVFSLVRFEIPMHNAIVVKILQCQDCFSKVQPCHFYRQWAHVLEQVGTISTFMKQKTIGNVLMANESLFLVLNYH